MYRHLLRACPLQRLPYQTSRPLRVASFAPSLTGLDRPVPRQYSWQRPKEVGTGKLRLKLSAQEYGHGWSKAWDEGKDGALQDLIERMAREIGVYYLDLAKKRAEEEERRRVEHERWLKEEEARKKVAHRQALDDTAKNRAEDLFRAAEWARLHELAKSFVAQCEKRWSEIGQLTSDQSNWLEWARETIEAWSPWASGYPDPIRDGTFAEDQVPFGGPYPPTRNFPRPPSMPQLKVEQQNFGYNPQKEKFPFWLRNPKR